MPRIGSRGADLQKGEPITLFASAPRTVTAAAGVSGDAFYVGGERVGYAFYLDVTAVATAAGDILDVYIEWSLDGTTWFNGASFPSVVGDDGVRSFYASFVIRGEDETLNITDEAAAGDVRSHMLAPFVRGHYIVTQADAATFTFSLIGYAI
jgi:hypothetical protein